jgi:hypothetical protein
MNEANNLYAFDAEYFDVPINVLPNADSPQIVYHRLRKPTLQELNEREDRTVYKLVGASSREDEIISSEELANARLWDAIILKVRGYRDAKDWRELTEEEKAAMRAGHKITAIRTLYAGHCEVEGAEDGITIGADTWTIRHEIGLSRDNPDFVVKHILREPTEAERLKYNQTSTRTTVLKGAKRPQRQVKTKLKPSADLYDALVEDIQGGTVNGDEFRSGNRKEFLAAVDPIWKSLVIVILMNTLEAQISD